MWGESDRTIFVVGLAGVRVEGGVGEAVDLFVVHVQNELTRLHGGGVVGLRGDAGATTGDGDLLAIRNAELGGIVRMNLEVAFFGVKFAQDFGFVGAGLGVPLATRSASSEEDEGEFFAGGFGEWCRVVEDEFGFATGVVVFVVFEKAALCSGAL